MSLGVAIGCVAGEARALECDEDLAAAFEPGSDTQVVAVKAFKKGDPLTLSGPAGAHTPSAASDICMVKVMVGSGNPGPSDAPSTSQGIGIEIWLPSKSNWNGRVHAVGGSGWGGGAAGSATAIAGQGLGVPAPAEVAGVEGAVSSTTDTGHAFGGVGNGSFGLKPDGRINTVLWRDFSSRAIHEQALKSKALASAYYGREPKYSYWEGGSTGGRQGFKLAQSFPDDFDGIIANYPAINWSRFITAELYPRIVFQRDLGGTPLSTAQQDLVSNAAIRACDFVGGQHLGYIPEPVSCTYDPTVDKNVLCVAEGGSNATSACVTKRQANVVNKIWYGMTMDGSVPSPSVDNGWKAASSSTLMGETNHRWFGMPRGSSLYGANFVPFKLNGLASPHGPFPIASDQVAIELQNPAIATPDFINGKSNGKDQWKSMSYAKLSEAYDRGVALQVGMDSINTDIPDLSAFKARGGKLLTWHGLADELIFPQGTVNYYNRVVRSMGGLASVQSFFRLYLVPGAGHDAIASMPNGTSNPAADVPLFPRDKEYEMLRRWVEKGIPPEAVTLQTAGGHSVLVCPYPQKAGYTGGDAKRATGFTCR